MPSNLGVMPCASAHVGTRRRILVTGASGLIGHALCEALHRQGFDVIRVQRSRHADMADRRVHSMDFARATHPADWLPLVHGVDAVVNAAGIFNEHGSTSFEAVHTGTPLALFQASVQAGVRRIVQISAWGATPDAPTTFLRTKWAADEGLLRMSPDGIVVLPSLVFGRNGASTRALIAMAASPWLPLPEGGTQLVQPIHVNDLVALLLRVLTADAADLPRRIPAVGTRPVQLRDYLRTLRKSVFDRPLRTSTLPPRLLKLCGRLSRNPWLDQNAQDMLAQARPADGSVMQRLLGYPQRPPEQFVAPEDVADLRSRASWTWMEPVARWSLVLLWIATGCLSLGIYPIGNSVALVERLGFSAPMALGCVYAGGVLDVALGAALLLRRTRRLAYVLQLAAMAGYTVLASIAAPGDWLYPFAPLLKNIPIAALTLLLLTREPRPSTT